MTTLFRSIIFATFMSLLGIVAAGQDLGSSNKLFGKGNAPAPKKATPAAKKPVAKTTSAPARTANTRKKTPERTAVKRITTPQKSKATEPQQRSGSATAARVTPPAKANDTTSSRQPARSNDTTSSRPPATAITRPRPTPLPSIDPSFRLNNPGSRFKSFAPNDRFTGTPGQSTPVPTTPIPTTSAEYDRLLIAGNEARDDRDYAAAELNYRRARAARPRDARPVYGLGNIYSDQQRWEEAEKEYRAAIEMDPDYGVAYVALSFVLVQPIAVENLADRYEEAESVARKAIALSPREPLAYDQLGAAMELRGSIGIETENAYKRATQLDPNFAPAYAHLGRLLRRRGRLVEAKDIYSKAIKLATDVPTKILVAEVMQSEQRFADSEVLLREAVASDRRNPSALLGLGRSLMAQNKLDEAETVLKTALEVSQNGYLPSTMLASLYLRRKVYETAETYLFRVVTSVPSYEKRLLAKQFEAVGDGYSKSNRHLAAQRAYQHALDLDPDNGVLMSKLERAQRD